MQEHLPHYKLFSPNPQPYGYGYTPGACSCQSPQSPVPHLGVISCWRQKAFHLCACTCTRACAYTSTDMHTCTHICTIVHHKLKEIKKALPRTHQVHILPSPNDWSSLSLLKGVREECFLRDYYNHRHCHCYHCYLLIMMVLIIWICIVL